MKRILFYIFIASLCINKCCHADRKSIVSYSDLKDSLNCFISQAHPIEFPEEVPTLYYLLFYKGNALNDTIVIFCNGTYTFTTNNTQRLIGSGDVDGHICEIIYDGFEHLSGIVNEENLTLTLDDYNKYGYDSTVFFKKKYEDWYFRSGQHKRTERRAYKIHRPQPLERIY